MPQRGSFDDLARGSSDEPSRPRASSSDSPPRPSRASRESADASGRTPRGTPRTPRASSDAAPAPRGAARDGLKRAASSNEVGGRPRTAPDKLSRAETLRNIARQNSNTAMLATGGGGDGAARASRLPPIGKPLYRIDSAGADGAGSPVGNDTARLTREVRERKRAAAKAGCAHKLWEWAYSFANFYETHPDARQHRQVFEALMLSESEARSVYFAFERMDEDGSGEVSITEMLDLLGLPRTRFAKRVFAIFDADGSGEVDLREFFITTWNYCTLSKMALALFAFDLYDRDDSGHIDRQEMERMLRDVYGHEFDKAPQAAAILEKLRLEGAPLVSRLGGGAAGASAALDPDRVTPMVFAEFTRTHQGLLYPAHQLQQMLRRCVVGERFWNAVSARRVKLSNGETYVPIETILRLKVVRPNDPHGAARALFSDVAAHGVSAQAEAVWEVTGTNAERRKAQRERDDADGALTAKENALAKRKQKLEATARAVKHLNTIKVAARNGAGATPNKAKVYAA